MDVEWIREQMRARGLTQADLAARIGIPQNMLTKGLNGHRKLQAEEIDAIRRVFGYKLPEDFPRSITIDAVIEADDSVIMLSAADHMKFTSTDPSLYLYPEGNVARLNGNSAEPWALQGDLIFWGKPYGVDSKDLGRPVVAKIKGGPLVLKRLANGDGPGLCSLLAINPTHANLMNVQLEWASRASAYLPADHIKPFTGH